MKQLYATILLSVALLAAACGKTIVETPEKEKPSSEESSGSIPVNFEPGDDDSDDSSSDVRGTEEHPITVSDFLAGNYSRRSVWVVGYIVGTAKRSISNVEWERPFTFETSVLLADRPGETDTDHVMSVQLETTAMKRELGLVQNPSNLGRKVMVYGEKRSYLGIDGFKKPILGFYLL